jgi:hypothetical protein
VFVSPVLVSQPCPPRMKIPSQPCPVVKLKTSFSSRPSSLRLGKSTPCPARGPRPARVNLPRSISPPIQFSIETDKGSPPARWVATSLLPSLRRQDRGRQGLLAPPRPSPAAAPRAANPPRPPSLLAPPSRGAAELFRAGLLRPDLHSPAPICTTLVPICVAPPLHRTSRATR